MITNYAVNVIPRRLAHRRPGLSMVEACVCIVIVGVMLAASLEGLRTVLVTRDKRMKQDTGRFLAQDLMAEIMALPYVEPPQNHEVILAFAGSTGTTRTQPVTRPTVVFGPESGESGASRADFDDMDDYAGFSESPPKWKDGSAIPNATGWTRSASVSYADASTLAASGTTTDTGIKRVTVVVTAPNGDQTTLTQVCRSDAAAATSSPEKRVLSWIGVTLQVGDDANTRASASATVRNQPTVASWP